MGFNEDRSELVPDKILVSYFMTKRNTIQTHLDLIGENVGFW